MKLTNNWKKLKNEISFWNDSVNFTDIVIKTEKLSDVFYRHSIKGRKGDTRYIGKIYKVSSERIYTQSGIVFDIITEEKMEAEQGFHFLPIIEKPEFSGEKHEIEFSLENYNTFEIESYKDYLLLKNNEIIHTISYPWDSIVGEYIIEKNKAIHYNKDYEIMSVSEYNEIQQKNEIDNKYQNALSEGYIEYEFNSSKSTNRQGFLKLVIDDQIWDEEENENVIIIDTQRSGGGGRYAHYYWKLMIKDSCNIQEIYEGDFDEFLQEQTINKNTGNSSGHNPFEGLSNLFK